MREDTILGLMIAIVILVGIGIVAVKGRKVPEIPPEYSKPPPTQKGLTKPRRTEYQYIQDNTGSHLATMAGVTLCDAPCEQPTKGVSVTCPDCLEAIEAVASYEEDMKK